MPETWATSGLDLHLELRPGQPGEPPRARVRARLEAALREAARTSQLAPGTRLPSSRVLAADLGLARNTVAEAYAQLVAEGWLTARRGSGTAVADRPAVPGPATAWPATTGPAVTGPAVTGPATTGPAPARPGTGWPGTAQPAPAPSRQPHYDLRPGSPDLSLFPRPAWLAAARRAMQAAPAAALGYADPRGRPELRLALAGYLARARGVRADPDHIVICAGFTQGLALLSHVLRARGVTTLAVEACSQPPHRELAQASGLALDLLPVDGAGAAVSQLAGSAAGAVLLTPAHQFPAGAVLAPRRRTGVVGWARGTGGVIIEDDYDGEFRYDRQPVGAIQALAPEHVVYAGSASKSLAPGLRLGWLVLPGHLAGDVAAARARADRQGSAFDQLTLAEFISSGQYDRQVRRARLAYRRRRDRLVAELGQRVPQARVSGIAAGLHALLDLPPGGAENGVVARAARRGLALEGLAGYCAPGHSRGPALVLGYGTPPAHAFTGALARLCAVLTDSG
ncbi:MAG TPA: PLP-dependent aminotransferase family protein [Streptosporangiaceae bacterium]|nr:PLP-dependent aminotransferase family protein [Streptosporangiaceae bacterium]